MKHRNQLIIASALCILITVLSQCTKTSKVEKNEQDPGITSKGAEHNKNTIAQGKQIFRFDTFGDEDFWSGLLHIDKAIAGAANGGFGTGVSPATALSIGLKVDVDALP